MAALTRFLCLLLNNPAHVGWEQQLPLPLEKVWRIHLPPLRCRMISLRQRRNRISATDTVTAPRDFVLVQKWEQRKKP